MHFIYCDFIKKRATIHFYVKFFIDFCPINKRSFIGPILNLLSYITKIYKKHPGFVANRNIFTFTCNIHFRDNPKIACL